MILPFEQVMEYSQTIRQVMMDAGVEVLGPGEAAQIFAGLDVTGGMILPAIYAALKKQYSEPCAQGVAQRLGRAAFKYGQRAWGAQAGLDSSDFRLRSSPRKVRWLLNGLCAHLNEHFGASANLREDGQYWWLRVEGCPVSQGGGGMQAACPILTGLLQEMMSFAAGGRYHCVEETACHAQGAAVCEFRIEKKALD